MLSTSAAMAGSKIVSKAMKAHDKRDYQSALRMLKPALSKLPEKEAVAGNFYMGIILLKNAELHNSLYKSSLSSSLVYLKELTKKVKGQKVSRYASLFFAETLLDKGDYKGAIKYFEHFLKIKKIDRELRDIARVELALAYYKTSKKTKAKNIFNKIKGKSLEVRASLYSNKIMAGMKPKFDVNSLYDEYKKIVAGSENVASHLTSNMLYLLNENSEYDKAIEIALSDVIDHASFQEVTKDGKQIYFYNNSLLKNISATYEKAGKKHLLSISNDAKLGSTAAFHLVNASIVFADKALRDITLGQLSKDSNLPENVKKYLPIRVSANDYLAGNKKQALDSWAEVASQNLTELRVITEVISMCVYTRADCDQVIDTAKTLSLKGSGKKYIPLNTAIGRYLLANKQAGDALTYLELARDKSNKNKISANAPLLLVSLAEAYQEKKAYNESLEIYFEMSRYFPVVIQIQEAVQGIYSMQQKSAGDVKIF